MTQRYRGDGHEVSHLLVYLHGHGSSPSMVHPYFRQQHDDGWTRICPQAPNPTEGGWSWFDSGPRGVDSTSLSASVSAVIEVVDAALAETDGAWTEVVLGGFSQGGALAIAAAARLVTSGTVLGGLLLQAGFLPETFDDGIDVAHVVARSVLIQHGDSDEVVPPFMADDLAALIGSATSGPAPELQHLPGGHVLSPAMLDAARDWLEGLL